MRKLSIAALCLVALAARSADPEPASPVKVRALTIKTAAPPDLGGGKDAKVYTSEADLAKATTKEIAAEVAKAVKFADESVVVVSYGVSGPPFPKLEHEVSKKGKSVEFYYKAPKGPTGLALKLGLDFFAVTKGTTVKYVGAR